MGSNEIIPFFLSEGVKEDFLEFRTHSDAVVFDFDENRGFLIGLVFDGEKQGDLPALWGKFDCIGKKVEEDLIHPELVKKRKLVLWELVIRDDLQFLLLAKRNDDGFHIIVRVFLRIGSRMKRNLTAFGLRH